MNRTQAMTLGFALVAVLIGAGLGASSTPTPAALGEQTAASTIPANLFFAVYVSGWVATPGVVEVAEGSIVADAVAAAGGAIEGALLDSINLARPVVEGDHIQIPGPGEEIASSGAEPGGLISPNRADASELEELPGVGPVLAGRIVAHREAHGPFQTVEDLLDVAGIGEAKLAAIRDLIVVP
jgi:competence protein ComEA